MSTPMRKILATAHIRPTMNATLRTIDSRICHNGGVSTRIRIIITMGVNTGINEMITAMSESGLEMKNIVLTMGMTSSMITGPCMF